MQKLLNKFFSTGERALIRKDFTEIWSQKLVRNSLLVLPIIMSVGMPLLFLLIAVFAPLRSSTSTRSSRCSARIWRRSVRAGRCSTCLRTLSVPCCLS